MEQFHERVLLPIVFVCYFIVSGFGLETESSLTKCMKRPEDTSKIGRHCEKSCFSQKRCQSRRRKCVCDGICGPSCVNKKLRCKGLNRSIKNGKVDVKPYNRFQARAIYLCDDDYSIVGEQSRVCQGDGHWSGSEPKCILKENMKDCGRPPNVHNAHHNGGSNHSFAYSSHVIYGCNAGYTVFRKNDKPLTSAWCVGDWVGPIFTCIPNASCPELPVILNGGVNYTRPSVIGTVARYYCARDFHLSGKPSRTCLEGGKWNGHEPSCEQVKCPPPPKIANAYLDESHGPWPYPAGQSAVYRCMAGFTLKPRHGYDPRLSQPPRVMCKATGKWSSPTNICTGITCPHPGQINNGRRIGELFGFNDTVIYRCKEGFTLIGHHRRTCQSTGIWSGISPTCRAIVCRALSEPEKGRILTGAEFKYGGKVKYECDDNYKIIGSRERTCMSNGQWSGTETRCVEIDCGMPEPIYEGFFEGQQTTVNSLIKFRCNPFTTFFGSHFQAVCLKNGNWSAPTPKCLRQCRVRKVGNATTMTGKSGVMVPDGTTVQYRCIIGLELDDLSPVVCHNGSWTHIPSCGPAPCRMLPPRLAHGRRIYFSMTHNSRVRYRCLPGYFIKGVNITLTCKFGEWKGEPPTCHERYCPNPGTLKNGLILKRGYSGQYPFVSYIRSIQHGQRLVYECNIGYELAGPAGATCVDGIWRPLEQPSCKPSNHKVYNPVWRHKRIFP